MLNSKEKINNSKFKNEFNKDIFFNLYFVNKINSISNSMTFPISLLNKKMRLYFDFFKKKKTKFKMNLIPTMKQIRNFSYVV